MQTNRLNESIYKQRTKKVNINKDTRTNILNVNEEKTMFGKGTLTFANATKADICIHLI